MDSLERYLGDTYELVDTLKNSVRGFVAAVYDKRAKRLCVMKQRELNCLPIYRTLKELNNPHVPQIYRLIERDGKLIVIEEHIDGQTLEEFLIYRQVDETLAEKILLQICECLAVLHEKNIIHRDLKPSNIMLTEKNFVKVIDFGIARIFKPENSSDTELLGTRGYAPPEQFGLFDFGQTDRRSDIYALGITIKNLLGENYDGRLKKILDKCTALEPSQRFQSAEELCRAVLQGRRYGKALKIFLLLATVMGIYFFANYFPAAEAPQPAAEEKFLDENRGEFNLSLGKLKLGDSVEIMRQIFGREDRVTPSKIPNHRHAEYKNIVVILNGDSVEGLISYGNEIQTERGIHQGSTLAEVIAAYGQRAAVYEYDGLTLYEYPYESVGGNLAVMRFAIKNNVVDYISLRLATDEREDILQDVKTLDKDIFEPPILPQISLPETSMPTPAPLPEVNSPQTRREEKSSGEVELKLFLNGEPTAKEHMVYLKDWQNWTRDKYGQILFPNGWHARLRVENHSGEKLINPRIAVNIGDDKKNFSIPAIDNGQSFELNIPLGNKLASPEKGSGHLQIILSAEGVPEIFLNKTFLLSK